MLRCNRILVHTQNELTATFPFKSGFTVWHKNSGSHSRWVPRENYSRNPAVGTARQPAGKHPASFVKFLEEKLRDGKRVNTVRRANNARPTNTKWWLNQRFSFTNIFTCGFSGYSQSWGTHIGQAVYLQIADPYTHKEKRVMMANFPKNVGRWGGFVSNRSQQSKASFPSIPNLPLAQGFKKYSKTYNHQRSSTVYFIKISPWCSTDSQIWLWKETYLQ